MQVSVQDAGPGTVELEVLVESEQYGKAMDEVMDQIASSTQIPGFRKGKAPRVMVERSVNADVVRARAIDKVLPGAYKQALEETGLDPMTDPEVELLPSEDQRELRFKLIVHKRPEITPGPIRGLELTRFVTRISDQDVEDEIQRNLEEKSYFEDEPGAVAEKDNVVVVDLEVSTGGVPIPESTAQDLPIHVGSYSQVPSIDDDLIGVKAGDVLDIAVQYPEDFNAAIYRGLSTNWHVTIKEVRRRHVPELTADLVKEMAAVDSVQQYRDLIRRQLEERAQQMDEMSLTSQAMNKLLESSEVVFPRILVEQQAGERLERLERNLKRGRQTLEDYAALRGVSPSVVIQQFHDQAEADLREYFLILRIAADEGIQIGAEEVDARIEQEGQERGARAAIINLEKSNEGRRNNVSFALMKERVLDLAVQNATITQQDQSLAEAARENTGEDAEADEAE